MRKAIIQRLSELNEPIPAYQEPGICRIGKQLPVEIRRTVAKQFQLLQMNQSHPSLRFKKVLEDGHSVLHIIIGL